MERTSVGNPLYCATQNCYLHVIEYLVKYGANINQGYCGDTNMSLLCFASNKGYLKIVKELVRLGADINLYDEDGRSPLYYAVYEGHLEIVKYLINNVLSINICDRSGKSSLYYASAGGNLDVVKFLINSDADANYDVSCLFVACHRGHCNIVEYLVDKVKNISSCDGSRRSPLYYASAEGHLDIVKRLVMNHVDVNCGARCLSAASNRGHYDIVEYLSDKTNVNEVQAYSDPPLNSAASSGHLNIVKYLVAHGSDVNLLSFWNESPLYCATKKGQLHVIEYLVEHGADINQGLCDDVNTPPLCCASSKGYLEIVKGLVERGVDVNICDLNGDSPLCYASRFGHLEIVKFLLQNNADFNIGASCLSSACDSGHSEVVEYLSNIMDVNKVNDICDPALHCAAGQGHIDIVKYLVEAGANVNLLSFHGYSPLCGAVENKHIRVVEYLVGHGAHIEKAVQIAVEGNQRPILDFLLKLLN